jgi:acylphosphatase
MIRQRIVFTGRVQGVGFRATTRHLASDRPLTGWVMNQPDGSVLLEVQGVDPEVRSFLDDLRSRMGRHIAQAHADSIAPIENDSGFEVRR